MAPKKPPSAFFLFCRVKRAELQKASSNMRPKDVTVELAKVWNELGEEEKAPYVSEYTKLWKEFKVEMNNYMKSKKTKDVMYEKEGEDMEERGDGSIEGLETGDVEVKLEAGDAEVNLDAGNLEINMDTGNMEVKLEVGDAEVNLEAGDAEVNLEVSDV